MVNCNSSGGAGYSFPVLRSKLDIKCQGGAPFEKTFLIFEDFDCNMLSPLRSVSSREIVIILHTMALALKTLHEGAGITHRLVEPSHIFKMRDGSYKLGGFDIATAEEELDKK